MKKHKFITLVLLTAVLSLSGLDAYAQSTKNTSSENALVHIKGGTFTMGSPDNEKNRFSGEVQRQVKLSDFYISKYLVTKEEYNEIMGPKETTGRFTGKKNLPAELITWYKAVEYCNKRSEKENLTKAYKIEQKLVPGKKNVYETVVTWDSSANGYRLPTEAEWEYAARAGTKTMYYTGSSITTKQANYGKAGKVKENNFILGKKETLMTTPVGSFPANAWGLYDMYGNVWEWCWDWYDSFTDDMGVAQKFSGVQTNPKGPSTRPQDYDLDDFNMPKSGDRRVIRGGAWNSPAHDLRSARRKPMIANTNIISHANLTGGINEIENDSGTVGFRVVRSRLTK